MAQVLVRDLPQEAVDQLKARAARSGRSLEAELRLILIRAGLSDMRSASVSAERIRASLRGREHTDSAGLVDEDRRR